MHLCLHAALPICCLLNVCLVIMHMRVQLHTCLHIDIQTCMPHGIHSHMRACVHLYNLGCIYTWGSCVQWNYSLRSGCFVFRRKPVNIILGAKFKLGM